MLICCISEGWAKLQGWSGCLNRRIHHCWHRTELDTPVWEGTSCICSAWYWLKGWAHSRVSASVHLLLNMVYSVCNILFNLPERYTILETSWQPLQWLVHKEMSGECGMRRHLGGIKSGNYAWLWACKYRGGRVRDTQLLSHFQGIIKSLIHLHIMWVYVLGWGLK